MLEVADITVPFGGVTALDRVSLAVDDSTFCAVIGPNGAGKTTLFNVLTGIVRPRSGTVRYGGTELTQTPRHRLAHLGISRTFQNLALCRGLTVIENVMVGAHHAEQAQLIRVLGRDRRVRRSERETRASCTGLLRQFGLDRVADYPVGSLPYGSLKRVELARALAARPSLLLLDEPAAGLNHDEVASLAGSLREIHAATGLTVVLVEHHMSFVMSLAEQVIVLNLGQVLACGPPAEVVKNPAVVEAYLGADAA